MKKTMAIVMSAVLTATLFSACTPAKTPEEAYSAALGKTAALTSRQIDVTADVVIHTIMDVAATAELGIKTNSEALLVDTKTIIAKQTNTGTVYFADGYVYNNLFGEKAKVAAEEKSLEKLLAVVQPPKAGVLDMLESEVKNGGTTFLFKANSEKYRTDILQPMLDAALAGLPMGMDIKFSDIAGSVVVNAEGYVTKHTLTAKASFTPIGSLVTEADVSVTVNEKNHGEKVTITAPTGLDSYRIK